MHLRRGSEWKQRAGERAILEPLRIGYHQLAAACGAVGHHAHQPAIALRGSGLGDAFQSGPTAAHAFAYELPGQLQHPEAYETLPAETVGNERNLRVRTRLTTALVKWALDELADTVDVADFTAWLTERQSALGGPVLDRDAIRKAAIDSPGNQPPTIEE